MFSPPLPSSPLSVSLSPCLQFYNVNSFGESSNKSQIPRLDNFAHILPPLPILREGCVSWPYAGVWDFERGENAERDTWGLVQDQVL